MEQDVKAIRKLLEDADARTQTRQAATDVRWEIFKFTATLVGVLVALGGLMALGFFMGYHTPR